MNFNVCCRLQTTRPLLFVLLVLALGCCVDEVQAKHRRYNKQSKHVRQKRESDAFWTVFNDDHDEPVVAAAKNLPIVEIPANDVQLKTDNNKLDELDRIKVVSSAIRVLPKRNKNIHKRYRRDDYEWRKPKKASGFVTSKLEKTTPTKINIYPLERTERYLHYNDIGSRRPSQQRRIIYYATLPEIVRPPVAALSHAIPAAVAPWYHQQQQTSSTPYFEHITVPRRDNEIARVHSSLIDVVTPGTSRYYSSSYSTPSKFTIIDMEPPYNYAQSYQHHNPPPRYDRYEPLPPPHAYPNRYYDDIRTPPYRYHYVTPAMDNALPDNSLQTSRKPVMHHTDTSVNINHSSAPTTVSLEPPLNNTRIIPNGVPIN